MDAIVSASTRSSAGGAEHAAPRAAAPRRALRIAMVTETYPPEVNGVARTLAIMVSALRERGHALQLVRPHQGAREAGRRAASYRELLVPGFPIPRYSQLRFGLPAKRRLLRSWCAWRPDVVHVATEGPLGASAIAAARALRLPVASDFHTNFHAYSRHYGFAFLARPLTAYLRRFHNRTDCTIVPTDEMADDLARLGFERLRIAGRGVDATVFSPARRDPALRARWGADEQTLVVLCVSRFAPEKNFPLVIEAFEAMRQIRRDARLILVGDGPMSRTLAGRGADCVVSGRLVNGELSTHYASADAFLFASTTETFGNVTLEAMASGLGIVAYDYAAARQVLRHEHSALLAPIDDARAFIAQAKRLAETPALARTLGAHARVAAEALSWARAAEEFEHAIVETWQRAQSTRRTSHAPH